MLAQLNAFLQDDHGAQVVEYALIIAVISIVLVIALQPLFTTGTFTTFIKRLSDCLNGTGCA